MFLKSCVTHVNCACKTLMKLCCSRQGIPWKTSKREESQASEMIHRALQWQIRKAIWFSLSTLRTCSYTAFTFAQALTFMSESDEINELLTKKMLRVLGDILLSLINPMHREETFAFYPFIFKEIQSQVLSQLQWSSFQWTIAWKCHTPLWPA